MSPISVLFGVMYTACIAFRPGLLPWMLAASLPFSYTAVISIGPIGLTPFWVGAILAVCRAAYLLNLGRKEARRPKLLVWSGPTLLLALFVLYSLFITAIGPYLFAGAPVITPRGGLDTQIGNYTPLQFSASNVSQVIYLVLGAGVVIYLMLETSLSPRIFEAAIIFGLGFAVFREWAPQLWIREWFDNLPRIHYATYGGRQRGSFAEPSILGAFVTCSLAYSISALAQSRGAQRIGYAVGIVAGVYVLYISSTGTALVGLLVTGVVALVVSAVRAVGGGLRGLDRAIPSIGLLGVLVFIFWDQIYGYAAGVYVEKLGTSSYANRNSSNQQAMDIFTDSIGLGVGLGSNRPSSLGLMLLSCVGVIGTLAYTGMVSGYLFKAASIPSYRPTCWALVAMVAAMVTSKPDLSMPFAWLLIGICAAGFQQLRATSGADSTELNSVELGRT